MEPNEKELDISYDQGLLEGYAPVCPDPVKAAIASVVGGVDHYRNLYNQLAEDYELLQKNYNNLTALTAGYLQIIQELRQSNDALLVESQREFHHRDE